MKDIFFKGSKVDTVGKTITEYDVVMFQEFASLPKNNSSIVPQTLVQMISIGLLNRSLPLDERLVAVIGQSWEFVSEVFIGDTLDVLCEVEKLITTKKKGEVIVKLQLKTINQNSNTVATGEWKLLIFQ